MKSCNSPLYFFNNISNSVALKEYVTETIPTLQTSLKTSLNKVGDKVTKIKLNEVINMLKELDEVSLIKDKHILTLLRYYELDKELKGIK